MKPNRSFPLYLFIASLAISFPLPQAMAAKHPVLSTSATPAAAKDKKRTPAQASPPPSHPNAQLADKEIDRKVESLISSMTLAEKAGQLAQYTAGFPTGPGTHRENYEVMITKGEVGSLLNVNNAADANKFQHVAMEKSRLHIPLLFGLDVVHGDRTTFPVPLGMAASFDPTLVEQTARVAATESRADGVNWVFSPMVDIARDARWGRMVEGAGEDPYLGSAMARAYVAGYQGKDLASPDSVAACVKHFAAYGAPVAGRDYNAVDMSEIMLRQNYLPTYHAAIAPGNGFGAATVMSSFNSLNGVPATANPFIQTQVLRKEWGFDGLVVSDYGAISELLKHSIAADGAQAAEKALTAGVDMDMEGDLYRTRVPALVQSGQMPIEVVDEAVRRILRVKYAMGLFEHPYAPDNAKPYEATESKRKLARAAAEESLVLLKNEALEGSGPLLPFNVEKSSKTPLSVALIGPFADSKSDMLGSWAGSGDPGNVVTLRAALEARLPKGQFVYAKGTDARTTSMAGFDEAVAAAKRASVVILTLGEAADETGEATSKTDLNLPGNQQQLLEAIVATGKPVVLVIFSGRPLSIPWAARHVPSIVEAWFPGIEAGPALADTLFGDANFSGKLPVEFPQSVGQEPLYLAQLPTGRPAGDTDLTHPPTNGEEKYLSRYIDETNAPVFPFGWGLSYAHFSYSPVTIQHTMGSSSEVGKVEVSVDVKNTSAVAGTEAVQLYIRDTVASVEQPVRELKGFERVTLGPGEQKHVSFTLGFDDLAFYNVALKRVVEPGTFKVWVGGSSAATNEAEFTVMK
jgi:beta-glucosidase